ncbi:MAG TPA: ATP-binding protein [Thermodesulfovibrionales bacterium]|nr:ATP-binding protein [Thermodesulfovibrionales bacterium]
METSSLKVSLFMNKDMSLTDWLTMAFTEHGYTHIPFEDLPPEQADLAAAIHRELTDQKKYSMICLDALNNAEAFYDISIKALSALIEIGKLGATITNKETLCKRVVEILSKGLDFENCSIMLRDPGKDYLVLVAGKGSSDGYPGKGCQGRRTILRIGEGVAGRVAETGTHMFVQDVTKNKQFKPIEMTVAVGSLLAVPLKNADDVVGVINFSNPMAEGLDMNKIRLVLLVSDYVGQVMTVATLQSKMNQWNEMLKAQKLESLGVLAGGIAHDFNNILTSIMGNISLIKMGANPGEKIFARLSAAEKASMRAVDLTQQLLTFSKGGAPVKKTTSIAEIIRDSAGFALRGSNVNCEFHFPEEALPVEVDEGQISQVINNMVINANQAMPEGGTIVISAGIVSPGEEQRTLLPDDNYVMISIEDHGTGIPKEHLSNIFDPFFTTKQKGSGLGLAVSYSIIKNHDGHISVESELGIGTTFRIYLPSSQKQIASIDRGEETPIAGKGNILIMDDEEIVRDAVGEMLEDLGYTVTFAKDGAEAISLYKDAKESGLPFDVVIMDLTVPGGIGGKEATKELSTLYPDIRAIVSSGYSQNPVMSDFRKYGFVGVITKPYKIRQLSEELDRVMNS